MTKTLNPAAFWAITDCPFCDGRVGIPKTMEGVCHETPACEKFVELDPQAYMAAVMAVWDAEVN